MLACAAGVLDVTESTVNLLRCVLLCATADRDRMDCRWPLLDLAGDVGDVLARLIVDQARAFSSRITLALPPDVFFPLLRVARIAELQILRDLDALLPHGIQRLRVEALRLSKHI